MRSRKMQPCCRTSLTAVFNGGVIMSKPFPEYRDLHAVQEQRNGAHHKHGDGQEEQKSLIPCTSMPRKVRWLTRAPPVAAIARNAPAHTTRGVSSSTAAINSIIPDPMRPETSTVHTDANRT